MRSLKKIRISAARLVWNTLGVLTWPAKKLGAVAGPREGAWQLRLYGCMTLAALYTFALLPILLVLIYLNVLLDPDCLEP